MVLLFLSLFFLFGLEYIGMPAEWNKEVKKSQRGAYKRVGRMLCIGILEFLIQCVNNPNRRRRSKIFICSRRTQCQSFVYTQAHAHTYTHIRKACPTSKNRYSPPFSLGKMPYEKRWGGGKTLVLLVKFRCHKCYNSLEAALFSFFCLLLAFFFFFGKVGRTRRKTRWRLLINYNSRHILQMNSVCPRKVPTKYSSYLKIHSARRTDVG